MLVFLNGYDSNISINIVGLKIELYYFLEYIISFYF